MTLFGILPRLFIRRRPPPEAAGPISDTAARVARAEAAVMAAVASLPGRAKGGGDAQ